MGEAILVNPKGAMPSSDVVDTFWTGTQEEYDALLTKNSTTLYLIKEEG